MAPIDKQKPPTDNPEINAGMTDEPEDFKKVDDREIEIDRHRISEQNGKILITASKASSSELKFKSTPKDKV